MAGNRTGTLLREWRKQLGLSCADLAGKTGERSSSTISRIENGSRHASRDTLLKIAMALHLDASHTAELLASAGFVSGGYPLEEASIPGLDETSSRIDRALRPVYGLNEENRLQLVRELRAVVRQVEQVWAGVPANPIPYLPEHGLEHNLCMLEALARLFGKELGDLDHRELALLCFSIALYDIGMALGESDESDQELHRDYHARSARYVRDHYLELGMAEGEATVVSNLCEHHRTFKNLSALHIEEAPGALRAHKQSILLAFLRLADILEVRPERVGRQVLRALVTHLPATQEVLGETLRNQFVDHFRRDGTALVAEVRYSRNWGQESIRTLMDTIGLQLQSNINVIKDVLVEAGCPLLRARTEVGAEPRPEHLETMEITRRSLGRFPSARRFFESILDSLMQRLQSGDSAEVRNDILTELQEKIELRPYHAEARSIYEELARIVSSGAPDADQREQMLQTVKLHREMLARFDANIRTGAVEEFRSPEACFLLFGYSLCVKNALAALSDEIKRSAHVVVLEFRTKSVYDSDFTLSYCDGAQYGIEIRDELKYENVWLAPDVSVASVFTMMDRLTKKGNAERSTLFPRRPTHLLLGVNAIVPFPDTKTGEFAYGAYSTTGYLTVAEIARKYGARIYVISECGKIRDSMEETVKPRVHFWLPQDHLWESLNRHGIHVYNPLDDLVPPELIDCFITEEGVMTPRELWLHRAYRGSTPPA